MPGLIFLDSRLAEHFMEGWDFSAAWPTSPTLAPQVLALLTSDGHAFEAVALMTKSGRRAATYTWHIAFKPVLPFDAQVELSEFADALSDRARSTLLTALERGGAQIADEVIDEVIEAITAARPDTADQIDEIQASPR